MAELTAKYIKNMRVVNFQDGNYTYHFDCVIRGMILMTPDEWSKSKTYLRRATRDWFWKKLLNEDIERKVVEKNGNFYVNVRVTATEKLFEKFKLPRYKRQNYMIKVII